MNVGQLGRDGEDSAVIVVTVGNPSVGVGVCVGVVDVPVDVVGIWIGTLPKKPITGQTSSPQLIPFVWWSSRRLVGHLDLGADLIGVELPRLKATRA